MTGFTVITVIMEVIMWIKTQDGDYYNLDHCQQIYLDHEGYTYFRLRDRCVGVPGDYRETVISNIISGTKLMEVQ